MNNEAMIDKPLDQFTDEETDREYRVRQRAQSRERQTPGSEKRTQTGGQSQDVIHQLETAITEADT